MPRRMCGYSCTNVDTRVGTIVWVRRRNGSWWPGIIISDAELSSANLLSPRSGTPVKLLGREDGSVDWYNIEKSKRVKPFHCGEFEECIEKVKAVVWLPSKKRERYARRDDAIRHALELEKQLESSKEFIAYSSTFKRDGEAEQGENLEAQHLGVGVNDGNLEVCSPQSPGILNGSSVPHFTTKRKRPPSLEEGDTNDNSSEIVVEEDALVEENQGLGGMEGLGVDFTCSTPENTTITATRSPTGVVDERSIDHGTPECSAEETWGSEEVSSASAAELVGEEALERKPADEGMYASILSAWPSAADTGEAGDAGKGDFFKEEEERENKGQRGIVPMVLLASRLSKRLAFSFPGSHRYWFSPQNKNMILEAL